jgi:hypothetical protein
MTPISDSSIIYGRYVSKKEMAVPLSVSRGIECAYLEEATKYRVASKNIEMAHKALDAMGVIRQQKNTPQFPLSLAGRIRTLAA